MIEWLDLIIEGDTHPRRFDTEATLRSYVMKVERLSEEAANELLAYREVSPPLSRRTYQIRPLRR